MTDAPKANTNDQTKIVPPAPQPATVTKPEPVTAPAPKS
jgi:hypothetical protein